MSVAAFLVWCAFAFTFSLQEPPLPDLDDFHPAGSMRLSQLWFDYHGDFLAASLTNFSESLVGTPLPRYDSTGVNVCHVSFLCFNISSCPDSSKCLQTHMYDLVISQSELSNLVITIVENGFRFTANLYTVIDGKVDMSYDLLDILVCVWSCHPCDDTHLHIVWQTPISGASNRFPFHFRF